MATEGLDGADRRVIEVSLSDEDEAADYGSDSTRPVDDGRGEDASPREAPCTALACPCATTPKEAPAAAPLEPAAHVGGSLVTCQTERPAPAARTRGADYERKAKRRVHEGGGDRDPKRRREHSHKGSRKEQDHPRRDRRYRDHKEDRRPHGSRGGRRRDEQEASASRDRRRRRDEKEKPSVVAASRRPAAVADVKPVHVETPPSRRSAAEALPESDRHGQKPAGRVSHRSSAVEAKPALVDVAPTRRPVPEAKPALVDVAPSRRSVPEALPESGRHSGQKSSGRASHRSSGAEAKPLHLDAVPSRRSAAEAKPVLVDAVPSRRAAPEAPAAATYAPPAAPVAATPPPVARLLDPVPKKAAEPPVAKPTLRSDALPAPVLADLPVSQGGRSEREQQRSRRGGGDRSGDKHQGRLDVRVPHETEDRRHYRELLTLLYQEFNPKKVEDIDRLLDKYSGQESLMYVHVCQKYNVLPGDSGRRRPPDEHADRDREKRPKKSEASMTLESDFWDRLRALRKAPTSQPEKAPTSKPEKASLEKASLEKVSLNEPASRVDSWAKAVVDQATDDQTLWKRFDKLCQP